MICLQREKKPEKKTTNLFLPTYIKLLFYDDNTTYTTEPFLLLVCMVVVAVILITEDIMCSHITHKTSLIKHHLP